MIYLNRLNGQEIVVNPDLILSLEATPDTVLTLINGEKFILQDSVADVVGRFLEYKRAINPLSHTDI